MVCKKTCSWTERSRTHFFLGSGRCLKKSLRFGVRERATNRRFCPKGEGQVYGPSPPPGAGGGAKKGADNSDRRDRTKWYSPATRSWPCTGSICKWRNRHARRRNRHIQMAKSPQHYQNIYQNIYPLYPPGGKRGGAPAGAETPLSRLPPGAPEGGCPAPKAGNTQGVTPGDRAPQW